MAKKKKNKNPYANIGRANYIGNRNVQKRLDKAYTQQKKALNNSTNSTVKYLKTQKSNLDKDLRNAKSSAYTDYVKTINPYGAGAESQVSEGLGGSGFSESSKINANNARQVKISNAYDTNVKTKQEFDNKIAEARNNRDSKLGDLAFKKAQMKNSSTQQWYQNKFNLTNARADWRLKNKKNR